MIRILARSLGYVAGSVVVAAVLLACAVAAATGVVFLGCMAALVGPRKFPWNLVRFRKP